MVEQLRNRKPWAAVLGALVVCLAEVVSVFPTSVASAEPPQGEAEVCHEAEQRILSMAYRERAELPGQRVHELLAKQRFKEARQVIESYQVMYQDHKYFLLALIDDQYNCTANERLRSFSRDSELIKTEESLISLKLELERIKGLENVSQPLSECRPSPPAKPCSS